jgi:hypothetical protein
MNISKIARTGYMLAAIAVTPMISMGAGMRSCTSAPVTEASYSWNFPREASSILKEIRADALQAESHADQLRSYYLNQDLDWQVHSAELMRLKAEVNDIGARLCRLETIRSAASPWEQQATDRTAVLAREMANNTEQAINYMNSNHLNLWTPTYEQYVTNLYHESSRLSRTIGNFEKLAKVSREEKELHTALGTKAGS